MKKYFIGIILVVCCFPITVFAENKEVILEKCIDGDTAKFKTVEGDITTYRFLAIDTPEVAHPKKGEEPFGKEASEYTCNLLTNAKKIVLEFDDAANETDEYSRSLAWVFVDDELLQKKLVSQGFARVAYLYGDYKYTSVLQEEETLAKTNQVGIWSEPVEEEKTKEEPTKEEKVPEEKPKNFIEEFLDSLLETLAASINKIVDSILQRLEDML